LRFRHPEIADLAFTPDGKELVAGVGRNPLGVFDAKTGRKLREVGKVSANNNYGFALSPDGTRVACCGFALTLWDLRTGGLVRELDARRCQAIAFSPDGARVAAVPEFGADFHVFDAFTGRRLAGWSAGEGGRRMYHAQPIAFSPDGKLLAALVSELRENRPFNFTAVSTQVRVWDAETGTPAGAFGTAEAPGPAFPLQAGPGRQVTRSQ